jgi:ferritin-like metal-binding protein YciE
MPERQLLLAWLNDAYAMEEALIPILENHAKDTRDHPQVRARIEQHLTETRQHADLVKGCIEQMGEKPSAGKSAVGKLLGTLVAPSTGPFRDELIKNAIADFAAEHFEIASYTALRAAAQEVGNDHIIRTCEQILADEQAMARWLEGNLPNTVHETLRTAEVAR